MRSKQLQNFYKTLKQKRIAESILWESILPKNKDGIPILTKEQEILMRTLAFPKMFSINSRRTLPELMTFLSNVVGDNLSPELLTYLKQEFNLLEFAQHQGELVFKIEDTSIRGDNLDILFYQDLKGFIYLYDVESGELYITLQPISLEEFLTQSFHMTAEEGKQKLENTEEIITE